MMPVITSLPGLIPVAIPSPSVGVLWLGPIPLRAYGILMVTAMALATWVGWKRYRARGGEGEVVLDVAMWAIPFGIVGARLYHVVTTPSGFFGPGADPWAVFRIWEGGLAIFGGIIFGALGALIALRRAGQRFGPFADAVAPGILFAQALGRVGNYFNQELYGSATTVPWGLQIDPHNMPAGYPEGTLFHPTFLYEGVWNVAMGFLLIYLGKRISFKSGQIAALYMVVYPIGRIMMEALRMDEAREFFGLRLNTWASLAMLVAGIIVFFICAKVAAPADVSAAERERYIELVAKRNPARAAELQAHSVEEAEEKEGSFSVGVKKANSPD